MRTPFRILIPQLLVLLAMTISLDYVTFAQTDGSALRPPAAKKIPRKDVTHDDTRIDDYFWLREKKNPEVISYLQAENAYAEAVMKPTEGFQQALYKEMLSHIKETDVNVPYRLGDYFYYSRTEQGKQYPIFCRKRGSLDAKEEITLDLNELAKGHKFLGLAAYEVSDDGNLLAYSTDVTGYRQFTLYVKDLRTAQLFPERIERTRQVMWATDNKTLFYVTEDAVTKRSDKFYRHVLGSDRSDLIYDEKDELYDLYAFRSRDKAFVFVGSESKTTSEFRYLPSDRPDEALRVILPREADHKYFPDHHGDLFYIRTNEGAKNYRIVTAPVTDPQKKNSFQFFFCGSVTGAVTMR